MRVVWRSAWFNIVWKTIGILIAYLLAQRYWPE